MSTDYCFEQSEVIVTFKNKQDMEKRIEAFEKECAEYTEDSIYCPAYVYQTEQDKQELKGVVHLDSSGGADVDEIANLICKHFNKPNGTIGYAVAEESAGGYVRCAYGGEVVIKNGKVLPPQWKQIEQLENEKKKLEKKIKELENDLGEALEYISMVVSDGDITECGVSHLFKKYCKEDYEEALRNKSEE